MRNDVPTWSLILQIAALILTLPLAVVGTILARKVEDWWARRTLRALSKRIETLVRELQRVENKPLLTENEATIAKVLEGIIYGFGVLFCVVIFLIYRSTHSPVLILPQFGLSIRDALWSGALMGAVLGAIDSPLHSWRIERTLKYRETLLGG